jgi:hypothetical protein
MLSARRPGEETRQNAADERAPTIVFAWARQLEHQHEAVLFAQRSHCFPDGHLVAVHSQALQQRESTARCR